MFSDAVTRFLLRRAGPWSVIALGYVLLGIVPLVFGWLFYRCVRDAGRKDSLDGLALGFAVAAWASVCWLTVPYCGGYPSLPGLVFTLLMGSGPVDTLEEEVVVHFGNFLVWPGAVWLVVGLCRPGKKPSQVEEL